jgi:type IX secretion system substrate protein
MAPETTSNTFCWADNCYGPSTYVSLFSKALVPDETATDFSGHYQPAGLEAETKIDYVFFDEAFLSDSVWIHVVFTTMPVEVSSFELSYDGAVIENGHSFLVEGSPEDSELVIEHLSVKNISGVSVDVYAKKVIVAEVENTSNTFCWADNCYGPNTYVSIDPATIEAGATNTEFSGHYGPAGTVGITEINYVFFNDADPSDTTYINVQFKTSSEGIEGILAQGLSQPYPNPANDQLNIDVDLKGIDSKVEVIISNLLGSTVKNIEASGRSGALTINVSDLDSGLYIYSVMVNGKIEKSNKLIIQH